MVSATFSLAKRDQLSASITPSPNQYQAEKFYSHQKPPSYTFTQQKRKFFKDVQNTPGAGAYNIPKVNILPSLYPRPTEDPSTISRPSTTNRNPSLSQDPKLTTPTMNAPSSKGQLIPSAEDRTTKVKVSLPVRETIIL